MIHGSMKHYVNGRKKKYNAWSTKKRQPRKFEPLEVSTTYRRETPTYSSADDKSMNTYAVERQTYTGTLIKGISTMHKSNAVPIINDQEAKDIANMRRN